MHTARTIPRESVVKIAQTFARQFRPREWNYLCSCRWFVNAIDSALETGGFAQVQRRAEEVLIAANLRKAPPIVAAPPVLRSSWWLSSLQ